MKSYSSWFFAFFRILFGIYLTFHFIHLIPYASELFGHDGILSDPRLNPAHGIFPNPLNWNIPGYGLTMIMALLTFSSIAYTLGWMRPIFSALLWFGWTALFHRNNLIANPSLPYIGLMLALSVIIPTGEPLALSRRDDSWYMPKWIFRSAWILLAAGYTFSGFTKLSSPSWIDGTAMIHLLHNPLARTGWLRDIMLALPEIFLLSMTWLTLLAELAYLPLSLWKRSRPCIWLLLVVMHFGIMGVVNFADLSLGMLMIHLFTFDSEWISDRSKLQAKTLLAFDGECLMCSRFIHFLAEEDQAENLRFTTLQAIHSDDLSSMQVHKDGQIFTQSSAFLAILKSLGGHWRIIASIGEFIPMAFRDRLYRWIADRRYRWFGEKSTCDLPSIAVTARMV